MRTNRWWRAAFVLANLQVIKRWGVMASAIGLFCISLGAHEEPSAPANPSGRSSRLFLRWRLGCGPIPGAGIFLRAGAKPSPKRHTGGHEMKLLDHLPLGNVADVWVEGNFVYVAGRGNGVHIIDAHNPARLQRVAHLKREQTGFCQDVKVSGGLLYATNESSAFGAAVTIWDVGQPSRPVLLGKVALPYLTRAHNVFIAGNILYCAGNQAGAIHVIDVGNPAAPRELARMRPAQGMVHDMTIVNGRCFGAFLHGGFMVADVSSPGKPIIRGGRSYTGAFTHNGWPTSDGRYLLTTDEVRGGHLRVWDISRLSAIRQVGAYRPDESAIIHNVIVRGRLAYISYYELGVKVVDVSKPKKLKEIGFYDTHPGETTGSMNGCWGVCPSPLNPAVVFATDRSRGLFALELQGEEDHEHPGGEEAAGDE